MVGLFQSFALAEHKFWVSRVKRSRVTHAHIIIGIAENNTLDFTEIHIIIGSENLGGTLLL